MQAFPHVELHDLVAAGEAELKTGPFGTQLKASEYTDEGTPVINVRNIGMGSIKADKLEFISEATRNRLSSHLLRSGDIVFGRKGAVERHVFISKEQDGWFQGSDCLRLRFISKRVLPRFASYFFLTDEHQRWMMNQCSHGATMSSLNQDILERISLPLPPVPIQRRIAGILSAYDELIENSHRRIKILESMARALYREWFVHFRFPGHESVPRVPSRLGDIPKGWEVKPLNDVVEDIVDYRGKTPRKLGGEWADEGILALSALNVKGGRLVNLGKSKRVDEELYAQWMKKPLRRSDILMTSEAPLGELFYLCKDERYCLSQRLFSIRADPKVIAPILLYLNLESEQTQHELQSRASGATVSGIRQSELRNVPVLVPALDAQQSAEPIIQKLTEHIHTLDAQVHNLRRTRDLLLPRLLSGQIDLSQAQ